MIGNFQQARLRHAVLRNSMHPESERIWQAVTGTGSDPTPGTYPEAVRDTAPVEYAALLATDEVAAAYAFELFARIPLGRTAFERRDAARKTWADFAEQANRARTVSEGLGWDLASAWQQTREVESRGGNLDAVERIARLAGRMYAALRGGGARKVRGVPEEVYSVELGNDVGRLLPSEQVQLDGDFEIPVLERIATRRAVQYAVRGTTKANRGPLVVCLDESGSMDNRRNEWAKACAIALSRVAREDKRKVTIVHYSTSAVAIEMTGDPACIVAMIRHFMGGGTEIATALLAAEQQVVTLARKGDKGADVVLVTDGVDPCETEQGEALAKLEAVGCKLWTIAIECEIQKTSPLRARAASYTHVTAGDLASGGGVVALAGAA